MGDRLASFVPSISDPWDERKAAHLTRRVGFGAPPAQLTLLVGDGSAAAFNAAVEEQVLYPDVDAALEARLAAFAGGASLTANPTTLYTLGGHWLFRMAFATRPLQEQLTLFWHDHFAVEFVKIRGKVTYPPGDNAAQTAKATTLLRDYMELLRLRGNKDFRTLLLAITRNPAMLLYLDNYLNVAGRAQENYARELMELFSMGVNQYTEDDVRELSRVLTGESLDDRINLGYLYRQPFHDTGTKNFLGQTVAPQSPGSLETAEAVDIILSQPVTSRFMASKLIEWFVNPAPDPEAVEELAAVLRADADSDGRPDFNFAETLEVLFKSRYFYEDANFFTLYKTPVDYGVNIVRLLGLTETQLAADVNWYGLAFLLGGMGMGLFEPPNVGGWIHGEAWINSVNLINRYNLAERVARSDIMTPAFLLAYFPDSPATSNASLLEDFRRRLIQRSLRTGETDILNAHMSFMDSLGGATQLQKYNLKIWGLAHLLCATAEFQMK